MMQNNGGAPAAAAAEGAPAAVAAEAAEEAEAEAAPAAEAAVGEVLQGAEGAVAGAGAPLPYPLGNGILPEDRAAHLLAQAATATVAGTTLQGVVPPARFLGANQDNQRLSYADLCQVGQLPKEALPLRECSQ